MKIEGFDIEIKCGTFCLGGSPKLVKTDYPDEYSVVKYPEALALYAQNERLVAALKLCEPLLTKMGEFFDPTCGDLIVRHSTVLLHTRALLAEIEAAP